MNKTQKKKGNIFIKTLSFFAVLFSFIFITSCTKSFCTSQDNANRLYATYGNIYASNVEETDSSTLASENISRALEEQKNNRVRLYSYLTQGVSIDRSHPGHSFPLPEKSYLEYMNLKVDSFVESNYSLWSNGRIDTLSSNDAKAICKHVAIYAGIEAGKVSDLFVNMNKWHNEAIKDLGYEKVPTSGYISALQSYLTFTMSSSTSCISPTSQNYDMGDKIIYIEGKSWKEAFSYGFFEGLFVWPFAALVHYISNGLGNTGWAQVFAIFVVTILIRGLSIYSTISQNKSQERTKTIQPELNALRAKYPNMDTDRQQRQAYTLEQMQLMRKAKTHPFRPMLFLFLQLPLFMFLWSALQGSSALASGKWLGVSLTTTVASCFTAYSSTPGALTGIIFFFITCAMSIGSNISNMAFNKWKQNRGIIPAVQNNQAGMMGAGGMTKMMSYIFILIYIFMAYRLPIGMNIYFYLGSVITIVQTIIMEFVNARKRHNESSNTGDGSDLAAIRRSSKHRYDDKKKRESKPLWR